MENASRWPDGFAFPPDRERAGLLAAETPARELLDAALETISQQQPECPDADRYNELWQMDGDDYWERFAAKEDLAIAPEYIWPDAVMQVALRAHEEESDKFRLEDSDFFVLMWPPHGHLFHGGDWHYPHRLACESHSERRQDCTGCTAIDMDAVVISPAKWRWTIEVQTWRIYIRPDGMRVPFEVFENDEDGQVGDTLRHDWTLGHTTMHPQQVWFGTSR